MEYVKKAGNTSTTAKVAAALGGAALGGQLLSGGGIFGALTGGPVRFNYGFPQPMQEGFQGGFVTEKEMSLIRESAGKDAVIARLEAEKYADSAIRAETEPLKTRLCNAETALAVNAARDADFRRYVDSEFVHQPKASIKENIVVCKQCGCSCEC